MIPTTELKKGRKVELDGKPYNIIQSSFTNPGKGSAFFKCRMKNLETGLVIERTFKSGVDTGLEEPNLEEKVMEYMYDDPEGYNFMDQETYESVHLTKDQVGDQADFLQEGIKFDVLYYNGLPIAIEVPNFIILKVTETDPGLKGDTAQGGTKKAIMETGLQINVPLFIEEGELLKIDTRSREYVERAKK